MAAIKKSVYLVERTQKVIATITQCLNIEDRGSINYSGGINGLAERFEVFVNDNVPELTADQWNVFYNIYNGRVQFPDPLEECRILPFHVSESYQYDGMVAELIGTEQQAIEFVEMVKGWSTSQRLAVIYKACEFWCKQD